jgi:hypothetical protein
MNPLWLQRKRLRIFSFILKEERMQKMLSEEEAEDSEEMIQMINKGKNKPEKKLIDNFWLGPELVKNISETCSNSKFQIETKGFMVHHLKETA